MTQFNLKNGTALAYRRLQTEDASQLQAFNRDLSKRSRDLFSPHSYSDETVAKIAARSQSDEDRAYIALDGEKIVAYFFLWWYQTSYPILGLGIADEYQGQGLGPQIMARLIEDGKQSGCDAIELTTALDNKRAFGIYEKVGFKCLGQVDNIDGDGRHIPEWHLFYPFKPNVTPTPKNS